MPSVSLPSPCIKGQIQEFRFPSNKKFTKHDWIVICTLVYNYTALACSYSIQGPFFPSEASKKGATTSQCGLIFGIFEIVVIIITPICSKLIVWITPRFMSVTGTLLTGVSIILFGLLKYSPPGAWFVGLAYTIRVVGGIGMALFMSACFNIISSEFPERVTTLFAVLEGGFGIGIAIGPVIGGALYQVGGFETPFMVLGILLLAGCLAQFLIPLNNFELAEESRSLLKYLLNAGVLVSGITIMSPCIMTGFNVATLETHLEPFSLSPSIMALFFMINGAVYAILAPIFGRLCDKGMKPTILLWIGCFCVVFFYTFIAPIKVFRLPTSLWLVGLCQVALGVGMAAKFVFGAVKAFDNSVERNYPQDLATHALVSTLVYTSCSLGAFIGPSLGGLLMETLTYEDTTLAFLIFELVTYIIYPAYYIYRLYMNRAGIAERQGLLN